MICLQMVNIAETSLLLLSRFLLRKSATIQQIGVNVTFTHSINEIPEFAGLDGKNADTSDHRCD